jgi:tetratricopeptide (TPR) repeat protein
MWDYDTLKMERSRFPTTLELITGKFLRHSPEFYHWRIKDREQHLKDHPSDMSLYDDLAVAYDKIGNDDRAIELMLEKEQKSPGLYETYANLGTFYLHSGQYDKGVAMIDKALAVNPDAHFGREKYQKYLAKYLATRRKDGKVALPLRRQTPYPNVKESDPEKEAKLEPYRELQSEDTFNGFVAKREKVSQLSDEERDKAIKGILGIMKFGKHDSPIILEALGDLLVLIQGVGPYGHGKELAARAYLKASYEVQDEAAKEQFRVMAKDAIHMRRPRESELTLDQTEKDFKKELADADAWYSDLRGKEIGWIHDGLNPETEFDKLYDSEPVVVSPQDDESWQTVAQANTLFWGRMVLAVLLSAGGLGTVAGILAVCVWCRKKPATDACNPRRNSGAMQA